MPKQRTLRHFKAALFETLSHTQRLALVLQLASGEKDAADLLSLSEGEVDPRTSEHLAVLVGNRIIQRRSDGGRAFYSLTDKRLGTVAQLIAGNEAWPTILAHPIRIEILELLENHNRSQSDLIGRMGREERREAVHHVEVLVSTQLVTRRVIDQDVVYGLDGEMVPQVLRLLREYFEDHLTEALLMVNKVSYQHLQEETANLKSLLTRSTASVEQDGSHTPSRRASNG